MSTNPTPQEIIASALQLPPNERNTVINALHTSLIDNSIDHDSVEHNSAKEVEAAWKDELVRRIEDIDNDRVKTISAEEAERMIRGDDPLPKV